MENGALTKIESAVFLGGKSRRRWYTKKTAAKSQSRPMNAKIFKWKNWRNHIKIS